MALRADDVDLNRDGALVARFQAGDLEAFSDLYRRYFARLHRFCQRRVGDSHEAEEIAQEAFTRAYRALPNLGGQRRFYPWVTVIAARLCIDSHRRRSRTEPSDRVDPGVVVGELDGLFNLVDHAYLSQALSHLAPRHREVLDLRERRRWSTARIAEHYGVNPGAVEALLHRARRSLRREYLSLAEGGGLLGALPLLGQLRRAFGRRLQDLRGRSAAWSAQIGEWGGPLVAKTASAAIALGGTAVLGGATLAGAAPAPARVPAVSTATAARWAPAQAPAVAA
ncbi:MAG: RNA polymerase sigma factor, partial [Acidimicrobiales bacterium]